MENLFSDSIEYNADDLEMFGKKKYCDVNRRIQWHSFIFNVLSQTYTVRFS